MSRPAVSLILATVGRTEELGPMFDSLAAQSFQDFEVIVVDQNLDDRIEPYVQGARERGMTVVHVKQTPPNLSAARNTGLSLAIGEWIGFPDDDCWYEPDLLANLKHRFDCTDPLSGAAVQWAEEGLPAIQDRRLTWERSKLFRDIPVASFQLFFHRGLFEKIGDFDPKLGVGLYFGAAEETDFVMRALRHGAHISYEPAARVHHPVKIPAPTPAARLAQRHRERGSGALWVKHQLPAWVVLRGLVAPVLRPLLKGQLGHDLKTGWAVVLGRLDGLLGWRFNSKSSGHH